MKDTFYNNYKILSLSMFVFFNLILLQNSNIQNISTWCFSFCGSNFQNFLFLIIFTTLIGIVIYFFQKFFEESNLIWVLLTPLIFPIFPAKGNENRELGLAYLQSNNFDFNLKWNGLVFNEQFLYNFIFKNIASIFDSYIVFLYVSRLLVGIIFIFSIKKIFQGKNNLYVILCIYLTNFFSVSFGGEYLLIGASPRSLAYSFSFLAISSYHNKRKSYILFSIITAFFHLHVYFLMLAPYLVISKVYKRYYKESVVDVFISLALLVFFIYGNIFSISRSSFFENLFLKDSKGNYISREIAENVIPFHVRPFNFDELNNFYGINENWKIGFVNLLIIIFVLLAFKNIKSNKEYKLITNLNFTLVILALLVTYFDKNGFLASFYLFKPAVYFSLFLFISIQYKRSLLIFSIIFSLIVSNWFFTFSSSYFEAEMKRNKFELIREYSDPSSVVVIGNNIRPLFSNDFVQFGYEEYFTGNNLMNEKEISLRNKLNFNSDSFCKELQSEKKFFVVSPIKLDCEKFYLFTINANYGNLGILGDPFLQYNELEGNGWCSESCIRFYKNF
ncbi:MAG: hypothetical protein CMC40_02605 [Flavobacteriaceae bacterium]|nr:hypothetical protein [Flavobacteriaceae bacterium]